jgi:phage FluMu protein Com
MSNVMREFRCPECDKLLFKFKHTGSLLVEIKCPRCKRIATLKQ